VLYIFYILNFTIFNIKVFLPPETELKDASDKDSINPVNMNMGILLNILLCEIVVFISICITYIITLHACGTENRGNVVVCYTTWGKHPANIGVGVAILLITMSILFSTLATYKEIIHSDSFISSYLENYLVAFTLLLNITLKSKINAYSSNCILDLQVYWFSNVPECLFFYLLLSTQFGITILIHVNKEGSEVNNAEAHAYKTSTGTSLLSLIPKAVAILIILINFVNLFNVSAILNVIHAITLLLLCISCASPYMFNTTPEKEKKG
jgi:hypothetical protein